MIKNKDVLVGNPKEFIDKELVRLEVAVSASRSAPAYSRDELLETMNKLVDLDEISGRLINI